MLLDFLYVEQTDFFAAQSDLERTDRIAREKTEGKATSLRRVSLSRVFPPFLPVSSVSFFQNYLATVLKLSPFFMPSACVSMRPEIDALENFTSYFIYVEICYLLKRSSVSFTQFSIL